MGRHLCEAEVPGLGRILLEEPRAEDHDKLVRFFESLSPDTIMLRFLRPLRYFEPEVKRILDRRYTAVAVTAARDGGVIGSGEIYKMGPAEGELAIVVHDKYRRRGLGTLIMYMLFREAKRRGLARVTAYTHETNIPMKRLAQRFGGRTVGMAEEDMYIIVFDVDRSLEEGRRALERKGIRLLCAEA